MSISRMYFCERCKKPFDSPDVDIFKEYHPEVGGNPFELMADYPRCPMCDSTFISEGYRCPVCGEYSEDTMHDPCRIKFWKLIHENVQPELATADDNETLDALAELVNYYI